jgi:hypothetical protein
MARRILCIMAVRGIYIVYGERTRPLVDDDLSSPFRPELSSLSLTPYSASPELEEKAGARATRETVSRARLHHYRDLETETPDTHSG